jgi:type I restriction-modification system DNA methylase subunit
MTKTKTNNEPIEKQLWQTADKLRKNIDAAEYKHIVLGLMFLKYISDSFEELYEKLKSGEGDYSVADPEDKDEYKAENVFFVPAKARWNFLKSQAKQPEIGKDVDAAMDEIEKENPQLKGVLPKVYARGNLDPASLGGLIDSISNELYETLKMAGSDGTAVPILNKNDFENIEISLPPLPEQKAIAEVLTSLDDKIDLLHKQNKTLEQLAETLFEEWIEGKDFDGSVSQLISIQNGYAFKSMEL